MGPAQLARQDLPALADRIASTTTMASCWCAAVGPTKQTRSGYVWTTDEFHLVDDFDMRNTSPARLTTSCVAVELHDSQRDRVAGPPSATPQAWLPLRHSQKDDAAGTRRCFASSSRRPTGSSWRRPRGRACASTTTSSSTNVRSVCTTMVMTAPLGIEPVAVQAWFLEHVAGTRPPLRFTLIAGGHSNLTYRVEDASGLRFALRRPPLGDFPRGAHDVLREYRILHALRSTNVPVPRVVAACVDDAVTGAPFYVMAWIDGAIVDRSTNVAGVLPDAVARDRMAESLVDAMADLHRVDIDAVGLGDLGPREDHLSRQIERMRRVWDKTKTRELPLIESIYSRLLSARPAQRYTGLVHSDFRLAT